MSRYIIMGNERGFSLIEVIIAGSLIVLISAGFGQMMIGQAKQMSYLEDKSSYEALKMQMLLKVQMAEGNCTEFLDAVALVDNASTAISIKEVIKNPPNPDIIETVFDVSDPNKNSFDQLNITNIAVQEIDVFENSGTGRIMITMDVERQRDGGGPKNLRQIQIPMFARIDTSAGNVVTGCASSSAGLDGGASGDEDCLELMGTTGTVPVGAKVVIARGKEMTTGLPISGDYFVGKTYGSTTLTEGSTLTLTGGFFAPKVLQLNGVTIMSMGGGGISGGQSGYNLCTSPSGTPGMNNSISVQVYGTP